MSTFKNFGRITLFLVASLVLGSCSAGEAPVNSMAEENSSFQSQSSGSNTERENSRYSLPSDSFQPPDLMLRAAAIQKVMSECQHKKGIQMPVTIYNFDAPLMETRTDGDHRVFTVEIAQKYGYREPLNPRIDWESSKKKDEFIKGMTEEENRISEECYKEVQETLQEPKEEMSEEKEGALPYWQWGSFVSPDLQKPELQKTIQAWRECMAPLGIPDLEETPSFGPPSQTLAEKWGYHNDTPPWEAPLPSEEEVRIAVADAQCQETSGYQDAYWEEYKRIDQEFVDEHRNVLERMKDEYDALEKRYQAVLQQ